MAFTGEILFHTIHGSHLYGTDHENSDRDHFIVFSNMDGRRKARNALQTIDDELDTLKTDLSTFLLYASKGVPQYLEAMYSRNPAIDALGEAFRLRFLPTRSEALNTYRRTIDNFYEKDDFKHKFHAWRLWFNMQKIDAGLVFNPTLSESQKIYINDNIDIHPLGEQ